jgi:NADPH-dependent curcumin reductase CurA
VIGIAGGRDKCRMLVEEFGFDVAREHIVHGSVTDFPEVLRMLFTGANTGRLVFATGTG